jgi:pilus assembly protein CpaE
MSQPSPTAGLAAISAKGDPPEMSDRRTPMRAYFLSEDSDSERSASIARRIEEVVPGLVKIAKIEEVAQGGNAAPSDLSYVLVVGPPHNEDYLDRLIATVQKRHDRSFFILISDEISATDYKRLIRTEGADWVSVAGAPHEILEIVAKRRFPAQPSDKRREPVTIAFMPAAGGVGNTTLVKEVGVQLKSRKEFKERGVCIVDLDFQTSHLCDQLDIEARLQIGELIRDPERFDAQMFEHFISRHQSGIEVFAAPRDKFSSDGVDARALGALFDMIAKRYEWTLIDLPTVWFRWTQEIIANSTGVIVTGINTIPCLRQVSETLGAIRSSRPESGPVAVVINRCEHGLLGGVARRNHVKSVLPNEAIFFIRDYKNSMVESINTGIPVSPRGNRRMVREIAAVTSFCLGLKTAGMQMRTAAAEVPTGDAAWAA